MAYLNVRIDDSLKKEVDIVLNDLGITMTAGITAFLKQIVRRKGIPFDLQAGPYYSIENHARLLAAQMLLEKTADPVDQIVAPIDQVNETNAKPASSAEPASKDDRRWKIVQAYLQTHLTIASGNVCVLLNTSPSTANRLLRTWTEDGLLAQYRNGRAITYQLPVD